jgi:hypothetical protein
MSKRVESEFDVRKVLVRRGVTVAMAFANPRNWPKRSTTNASDVAQVDETSNEAFTMVFR